MRTQNSGPDRQLDADVQPLLQLLPGPAVHADLAAATALPAADEDRAAAGVEVSLGERERFVDAQPGAPEHDDHSAHPQAMGLVPAWRMTATISSTVGGSAG